VAIRFLAAGFLKRAGGPAPLTLLLTMRNPHISMAAKACRAWPISHAPLLAINRAVANYVDALARLGRCPELTPLERYAGTLRIAVTSAEYPIVVCPGCRVAMVAVAARPLDAPFEETIYCCPACAAETRRITQATASTKPGVASS
jgi:hypothetical protein